MTMERTTVRGNRELAKMLGVHYMTVQSWRNKGILAPATIAEYGRVIIYDLDKVFECLHHKPAKPGRRATA